MASAVKEFGIVLIENNQHRMIFLSTGAPPARLVIWQAEFKSAGWSSCSETNEQNLVYIPNV